MNKVIKSSFNKYIYIWNTSCLLQSGNACPGDRLLIMVEMNNLDEKFQKDI
jgi:hypothetical protein